MLGWAKANSSVKNRYLEGKIYNAWDAERQDK